MHLFTLHTASKTYTPPPLKAVRRWSFVLALLVLTVLPIQAQNDKEMSAVAVYNSAEKSYTIGDFDTAEDKLLSVINLLDDMHRTSAYRILTLCELKKGNEEQARKYVTLLLKSNDYYTPTLQDPQRFIDLINEAKGKTATITTASRQAESLDESPVAVTLITEDMIRYSGASTIQELLCLYVPGMTNIEGLESNIAMHGIYGFFQDKILFLQDGHRLNGYSTNAEAPAYRNSLNKIQQIEVLRGPASSLYGNVALTAVVNIITKKGANVNGGHITGTVGTQKSYGGSFAVGGGNNVVDVMGWGGIYSTDGFKHTIANDLGGTTTLYSGAYNRRPSYDIGIKARYKDFTLTLQSQRSKKTPYINMFQYSATQNFPISTIETFRNFEKWNEWNQLTEHGVYDIVQNFNSDKYANINGNGPGITRLNHHFTLDYAHSFGNIDIQASGFLSVENTSFYNVIGDSIKRNLAEYASYISLYDPLSNSSTLSFDEILDYVDLNVNTQGIYNMLEWDNITFGGQAQMLANYEIFGKGTLIFGAQYEHLSLTKGTLLNGGNYNLDGAPSAIVNAFNGGDESTLSFYAQLKHTFFSKLILNAGLRFDHKSHYYSDFLKEYGLDEKGKFSQFSPRISLIYKFNRAFSWRASYNFSMVDAPYAYRACTVGYFSGGYYLSPETMKSVQMSLSYHQPESPLSAEICGFYNVANDLIDIVPSYFLVRVFGNSGNIHQVAIDASLQYNQKNFFLNANATWQKICSSAGTSVYNGNKYGIPQLYGNAVVAWNPYSFKGNGFFNSGRLWLKFNTTIQSKTYYRTLDFLNAVFSDALLLDDTDMLYHNESFVMEKDVPVQILLGIGITYDCRHIALGLSIKNLTNNEYMVGSCLADGIPHTGRQILGTLTVKF